MTARQKRILSAAFAFGLLACGAGQSPDTASPEGAATSTVTLAVTGMT